MITTQHRETPSKSLGYIKIYGKSDDKLYYLTSGGVEVEVGAADSNGIFPGGEVGSVQYKTSVNTVGGFGNWDGDRLLIDGDIELNDLTPNGNITFLQQSQAVISGASIAINTGAFTFTGGNGISYDGTTLVAPEITASTKLWSGGDADITGELIAGSADIQGPLTADSVTSDGFGSFGDDVTVSGDVKVIGTLTDPSEVSVNNGVDGNPAMVLLQGEALRGFLQFNNLSGEVRMGSGDATANTVIYGKNTRMVTVSDVGMEVNGATNFGRVSVFPTPFLSGDTCYLTTDEIPYSWNGTNWLEMTAGSAYGQLTTTNNAVAQGGVSTTFQKVTQYTANGIEEGGVVVDVPNDTITIPAGIWELSFSHSMETGGSNIITTFSVFDVADTGFTTPLLQRERKIGAGSDVGSMSGSRYVEFASTTTIAVFVKIDSGTTTLTLSEADFSVIKIK